MLLFIPCSYVILYAIIYVRAYAEFEPVSVHASLIPGVGPSPVLSPLPSYCDNPSYNAFIGAPVEAFSGIYFGPNISCRAFDRAFHVASPISNNLLVAFALVFAVASPRPGFYTRFTVGADSTPITLVHQYRTTSGLFSGINPPSFLHGADGSIIAESAAGCPLQNLPLSSFIAAAGANLDTRNPLPPNPPEVWPMYRDTGMVLSVRIEYSNIRTGEWPSARGNDVRADIYVNLLPGLVGKADQFATVDPEFGAAALTRTGVLLEVVGTGELGRTTLYALIFSLVQGIVLVSIGDVLTGRFVDYLYRRQKEYNGATKRVYKPIAISPDPSDTASVTPKLANAV